MRRVAGRTGSARSGRPGKQRVVAAIATALLLGGGLWAKERYVGPIPLRWGEALDAPAPLAVWPWPRAVVSTPHAGVTYWKEGSQSDGTGLHLFRFDFDANPGLRLELYDQDEDDARPHDNAVRFWPRGVAQATRHLNNQGRGPVVAAWNGLFFASKGEKWGANGIARHVGPVVLNGIANHNVGNHRWTFGVRYDAARPIFGVRHLPNKATLARDFSWASAGAQCLVRGGKPLLLQPFPTSGEAPAKQPVASTPREAGHIPLVDHIKTSRVSMAWTKGNRQFYLLFVKEPDTEAGSILALRHRVPIAGGWMVRDLQTFWRALGVWGAVNSDAGDAAQMAYRRTDNRYAVFPPRWTTPRARRVIVSADLADAPRGGGSLMYFYVRDSSN